MTALPLGVGLQIAAHNLSNLLIDANLFVAGDEHPLLDVVNVSWDGEMLIATAHDGYQLIETRCEVISSDRDGHIAWQRNIRPDDIKTLAVFLRCCDKDELVSLESIGERELRLSRIGGGSITVHTSETDAYPNTDHLWPHDPDNAFLPVTEITLNPTLLARIAKISAAKQGDHCQFRFHPYNGGGELPLITWAVGAVTAGLLAPMRPHNGG